MKVGRERETSQMGITPFRGYRYCYTRSTN